MLKRIIFLPIVFVLSACGAVLEKPQIYSKEFERELSHQRKLLKAYQEKNKGKPKVKKMQKDIFAYDNYFGIQFDKMLVASKDFCKYKMYTAGIRHAYIESGEFKGKQSIYGVTKGFPAYKAGLRKNDIILAINYSAPSSIEKVAKHFATKPVNNIIYYSAKERKKKEVKVKGIKTCQMALNTSSEKTLNAYADGKAIYMFPALYDFLGKDEYINTVIAHEIAHNLMSHIERQKLNSSVGQLAGLGIGLLLGADAQSQQDLINLGHDFSQHYSPEFEAEADYLGLYIMARAGYNINNTANTWRRMAMMDSYYGLGSDSTHPASPKRFVALKKTIKEINKKKKTGQPLKPNFGGGQWAKHMNWNEIKSMQESLF